MQSKCTTTNNNGTTTISTAASTFHISAERFRELCLRAGGGENTRDVQLTLEYLFNADKPLVESASSALTSTQTHPSTNANAAATAAVDLVKQYLTGGIGFDNFKNKLKSFDNSSTCGLVWNVHYVAYRCRTCALSPCMSICAECFKNGNHQGHDFNMFRSGAGGACDCGDEYVMNPKGFCKSHGCNKTDKQIQPPDELIKCCDIILPHLLYYLLQSLRKIYSSFNYKLPSHRTELSSKLNEVNTYVDLLNELCLLGTPLRKTFVDYMISEEFYAKKIHSEYVKYTQQRQGTEAATPDPNKPNHIPEPKPNSDDVHDFMPPYQRKTSSSSSSSSTSTSSSSTLSHHEPATYQHEVYLKALSMHETIKVPDTFKHIANEICKLTHKNMVDEFLFWCIRFEFPETLVKFLLSLLPDLRYKMIFIKSFVSQYSYISVLLLQSKSEHLSSRVVHISVQLFSNEAIAIKALDECYLLPIILSTLHNMIVTPEFATSSDDSNTSSNSLLVKSKLEDEHTNYQYVVDADHPILQENLYWLVISDLVNLFTHRKIANEFMSNDALVGLWFKLITYFQTMNLNVRKFGDHVLQEQPTYFSSFSAELEFCSSVMWSFIQHLSSPQQLDVTTKIVKLMFDTLKNWLLKIGLIQYNLKVKRPNFRHLSFHLPLHRYLACVLFNAVYVQGSQLASLFDAYFINPFEKQYLLVNILAHPLQLQIGFHEIHANMWVRNGMQMKGQAMTYVQNHFCSSFSDADLFLMQTLASQLDPDLFMSLFFERFHVIEWLRQIINERHRLLKNAAASKLEHDLEGMNVSEQEATGDNIEMDDDGISVKSPSADESKSRSNEPKADDLDPTHQTAMLVGALTVLAQLIMIKPNLTLKSHYFTRMEIIYILAISDRTYSQVEENLPDICSLSVAKKYIDSILSKVSDYLQPTLDLSISNLKQGRYKPKDSVWLSEYDPLYVMLRSVKRREFQESFDRYIPIVEKRLSMNNPNYSTSKMKKNIWPPFRLPGAMAASNEPSTSAQTSHDDEQLTRELENIERLDKELDARWDLLNTKVLHSVLLTILYEHHYVNPVSEKILYFVVYLLELAIYRAQKVKGLPKKKKDPESQTAQHAAQTIIFDECNYQTWFRGNEIMENVCTYVPFMTCELVHDTTNESAQPPAAGNQPSTSQSTTNRKLKIPPFKKIRSDIPSFKLIDSGKDNDSICNKKLKKGYICESILSLLVKIVYANKLTELENKSDDNKTADARNFTLEFDFLNRNSLADDFYAYRIGDESDFIVNVLEKAAKLDHKCNLIIVKTLETLNSAKKLQQLQQDQNQQQANVNSDQQNTTQSNENGDTNSLSSPAKTSNVDFLSKTSPSADDDLKAKKFKAKARQQKLLAQMSSNQKAFWSNPNNKLDVEAFNGADKQEKANQSNESNIQANSSLITADDAANVASTGDSSGSQKHNEESKQPQAVAKQEETYDCCICRLSSSATPERPIGMVALIQSTSVLGHRESVKSKNFTKKLPLTDESDSKQLCSDMVCWKQEETRVKNLCDAFNIESCKYSINIGWKGGVYAQMCGHYLHFDCYNSYKQTLDDHLLTRGPTLEYSCPLCRQIANCVFPVTFMQPTSTIRRSTSQQGSGAESLSSSLLSSGLSASPAKIWILSSLANKQNANFERNSLNDQSNLLEKTSLSIERNELVDPAYDQLLALLKTGPFSNQDHSSRILTQCKNEALTMITLATSIEYRYIDHTSTISNPALYRSESPVDDDIAMFTTSVLRTQLEIDLMLLLRLQQQQPQLAPDSPVHISNTFNFKKKRACFIPLFDVISTHCRLMCHEFKSHVKQWLMLINPGLSLDMSKFLLIAGVRSIAALNPDDALELGEEDKNNNSKLRESKLLTNAKRPGSNKAEDVPMLLRDPVATLLLIVSNLPLNLDKNLFNCVISNVFNLVFVQAVIDLCREFDDDERNTWSNQTNDQISGNAFNDYVAMVIKYLKNTNIFERPENNDQNYMKTIWTFESARNYVEMKCIHFVRIASLLQSYLYNQEVTPNLLSNFNNLVKFLNLNYNNIEQPVSGAASVSTLKQTNPLKWFTTKPSETIFFWLDELSSASNLHKEQVHNMLRINLDSYDFPQLVELPRLYSDLFSYYLVKKCKFCSKIPKDTAICLLCGTQVCYRNHFCCDGMKDFNKKHINSCGAGTLILLNVNSTYVVIIRGKRCAAWASLYLDEHGEEDRDLRRGKPLYLNELRYNLLKASWYSHSFDYQSLKWYNTSLFIN